MLMRAASHTTTTAVVVVVPSSLKWLDLRTAVVRRFDWFQFYSPVVKCGGRGTSCRALWKLMAFVSQDISGVVTPSFVEGSVSGWEGK